MMYPLNDEQFMETTIAEVRATEGGGWEIKRADGWCFFVPAGPVEPKVGMTARFYGRGIGHTVRGLFLDGSVVFYRDEIADAAHRDIEMYGRDASDWLSRWDAGRSVWSIEMGGLGPGYEQCIHIACAEILRHMLEKKYDPAKWEDETEWKRVSQSIDDAVFTVPAVKALGLSGAQWDAAMNIAIQFYRRGPIAIMNDDRVKDRHIQVSRNFPSSEAA